MNVINNVGMFLKTSYFLFFFRFFALTLPKCSCDFHKMLRIIIQQTNALTAHDGVNEIGACAHQLHLRLSVFFHAYLGRMRRKKSHAFISRLSKKTINQFQPFWFRYTLYFFPLHRFLQAYERIVHWCPAPNIKFNVLGISLKRTYIHIF